jgi:hypothetical protein
LEKPYTPYCLNTFVACGKIMADLKEIREKILRMRYMKGGFW